MVVITLLIDENVPTSVVEVFRRRGHRIFLAKDILMEGTSDSIVGLTGDRLEAILVTWDLDFRRIAARVSKEGAGRLRRLSRINFRCSEPQGAIRAEQEIEGIEARYEISQRRGDKRILVEIKTTNVTFW
jgi:predicted nuclease of predicted toxin-antitoxin system